MNFEALLASPTRDPRKLAQLLERYTTLQASIRTLNATDLYLLLRSEQRGLNRQSVVARLERRLRAVLVGELNEHFDELKRSLEDTPDE